MRVPIATFRAPVAGARRTQGVMLRAAVGPLGVRRRSAAAWSPIALPVAFASHLAGPRHCAAARATLRLPCLRRMGHSRRPRRRRRQRESGRSPRGFLLRTDRTRTAATCSRRGPVQVFAARQAVRWVSPLATTRPQGPQSPARLRQAPRCPRPRLANEGGIPGIRSAPDRTRTAATCSWRWSPPREAATGPVEQAADGQKQGASLRRSRMMLAPSAMRVSGAEAALATTRERTAKEERRMSRAIAIAAARTSVAVSMKMRRTPPAHRHCRPSSAARSTHVPAASS